MISGLAAEFGVVLAGIANELSPYAEARVARRMSLDKARRARLAPSALKTWKHVCMNISMTYTDPNLGLAMPTLAANPFVPRAALVAFAVEREVDPAAYAACLELLQLGEAALDNERSVDEDPAVAWRERKTFASMTPRRHGAPQQRDDGLRKGQARNCRRTHPRARAAGAAVGARRQPLGAPLGAAQLVHRRQRKRDGAVLLDFDVPLDGPGRAAPRRTRIDT